MRRLLVPLAVLAAVLVPRASWADETFSAVFVPRPGVVTEATGTAILALDESETQLSFDIRVADLGSSELAAHIHAPDGSILFPLPLGNVKLGIWQDPGLVNVLLLRTGQLYILVHTEGNPGGEIRGDIVAGPLVATPAASWGTVKARFGR